MHINHNFYSKHRGRLSILQVYVNLKQKIVYDDIKEKVQMRTTG